MEMLPWFLIVSECVHEESCGQVGFEEVVGVGWKAA